MTNPRLFAAPAERNRGPILEVLRNVLPPTGLILEVASGSGQHAAFFAANFPNLVWQPSDPDPEKRASIPIWVAEAGAANVLPPLDLDAAAARWPIERADAVVCVNMIHISPWPATLGLVAGAARVLPAGAPLYLYGPFRRGGKHTTPSNAAFDADLRSRNPAWGVRDIDDVAKAAADRGFGPPTMVPMPANNFSVIFRRTV